MRSNKTIHMENKNWFFYNAEIFHLFKYGLGFVSVHVKEFVTKIYFAYFKIYND